MAYFDQRHAAGSRITLSHLLSRVFDTPFDRRSREIARRVAALRALPREELAARGLRRRDVAAHVLRQKD